MKKEKMNGSKMNIKKVIIISTILVLFIPMLYSTIYLGAFWDPYENLENVPVAFVNLDKSVTKDGKTYEIGNDVEKNLKDNKKLEWKFVEENKADKGLSDNSYYAVVTIPEDFSKNISQVSEGETYNTEIIYKANKGKNFIFSQISEKAAQNIKSEVSVNIQKEISKSLVDNMYTIKDSIKDAEDGVTKLKEGTTELSDGSTKLSDGTSKAEEGSLKLQDGLKGASDGSKDLKNGMDKLSGGSGALSKGIVSAKTGSQKLHSGVLELSKGEKKVSQGTTQLVSGLEELKKSLTQSDDRVTTLAKGAESLSEYNSKLSQGTQELSDSINVGLNNLADNLKISSDNTERITETMKSEIQSIENSDMNIEDKERLKASIISLDKVNQANKNANIESTLRKTSHAAEPLAQNMAKLETETTKVSKGVGLLASSLEETQMKASEGVDRLLAGAKKIEGGSQSLVVGLNTVSEKTGDLSDGLGKVYEGSNSLNSGIVSAKEGASSLNQGLDTAYSKTGDLSNGIRSLNTGATSLNKGLKSLDQGSTKLKTGLNDGYEELNDKLKFNSDDMANFISNPVTVKAESINDINHYGEGLAPYFVSLSLWLGALFINLILSISKKFRNAEDNENKGFIKNLLLGMALVSVQAIILSVSLVLVLKIETVSLLGFYLSNIFISMVFFSLMYGVSYAIGIIGTPIMFIFFLLQISSAGGTFPIETAPALYRTLNNIIPMTYSVNLLRMVISGINNQLLNHNLIILLEFMIVSLVGGFLVNKAVKKVKENKSQDNKTIEI